MKITDYIAFTIDRLPKGYIFTYADFSTEVNPHEAIIKALNRMARAGKIAKLSKGKYYKPETSPFGDLLPNQKQVVKDLLEKDSKVIGYLTGYSIYNQLGLTTQISNVIQIGKKQVRPALQRDRYMIAFIRQKNTITKENIPLFQILDSIRFIKRIPDATTETSCKRLLAILKNLSAEELRSIIRLALKYPPSTRALLGAMLDKLKKENLSVNLFNSLNPITKYKLNGAAIVLTTAKKWNIV